LSGLLSVIFIDYSLSQAIGGRRAERVAHQKHKHISEKALYVFDEAL